MEEKSIALSILGIIAILAVIGLVLLFKASGTGNASYSLDGGQFSEFKRFGYTDYNANEQYEGDGTYNPRYYIQGKGTPIGTYN